MYKPQIVFEGATSLIQIINSVLWPVTQHFLEVGSQYLVRSLTIILLQKKLPMWIASWMWGLLQRAMELRRPKLVEHWWLHESTVTVMVHCDRTRASD